MAVYDAVARRDVSAYARRYFAQTITLDTFVEFTSACNDPLILALRDALIHEPPSGGFFGLRDRWWQSRFREPVERLLAELDKGEAGQVPVERVYPRITLSGLVLSALALLWAGLLAARNLDQLLSDLLRGISLPFWDALWRIVVVGTLAMVTVLGIEGWINRLHLYRTRKLSGDDAS